MSAYHSCYLLLYSLWHTATWGDLAGNWSLGEDRNTPSTFNLYLLWIPLNFPALSLKVSVLPEHCTQRKRMYEHAHFLGSHRCSAIPWRFICRMHIRQNTLECQYNEIEKYQPFPTQALHCSYAHEVGSANSLSR